MSHLPRPATPDRPPYRAYAAIHRDQLPDPQISDDDLIVLLTPEPAKASTAPLAIEAPRG